MWFHLGAFEIDDSPDLARSQRCLQNPGFDTGHGQVPVVAKARTTLLQPISKGLVLIYVTSKWDNTIAEIFTLSGTHANQSLNDSILLMAEILHQLSVITNSLPYCLQALIHPNFCRSLAINSSIVNNWRLCDWKTLWLIHLYLPGKPGFKMAQRSYSIYEYDVVWFIKQQLNFTDHPAWMQKMQVGQNSTVKLRCHISPIGVWITLVSGA